ncbi:SDR family oxidoreductase [Sulfurimonas sp. HSL1-6]|uniref:SDR family oxidoreductase n=1 Tax=Thiomicrolovo immobilis TaxID=3131935 RepID=UPI0031F872D0
MQNSTNHHIAIFGSTSYIGTHLIAKLYNAGYKITLFTRTTRKFEFLNDECYFLERTSPDICIAEQRLEVRGFDDIVTTLQGVDAVYYLVHSLYVKGDYDFSLKDNRLAGLVGKACTKAGVKQIIYLGGLGVETEGYPLSMHLRSRQQTAEFLCKEHDGVTEFRAGVIIGAGNSSFEIIRSLATKLPLVPKALGKEGLCQTIAVEDLVAYLTHALLNEKYYDQIVEIGSNEVLTYSAIVQTYADIVVDKKLHVAPLPLFNKIFTPYVLSKIISRMSGMRAILVERLLEGMNSAAIIGNHPVSKVDPHCPVKPKPFTEALRIAGQRCEELTYLSVWSTPYEESVLNPEKKKQFLRFTSELKEGMLFEAYSATFPAEKIEDVFYRVKDIGGTTGYYSPRWLWQVRGFIDVLLGGRGLRDTKRAPKFIRVGDRIDFWVVTFYKNKPGNKVLRLKAEMLTPGNAWLQFILQPVQEEEGKARLTLTAYFEPNGIGGYLYWYSLYFIHKYIFKTMVENILLSSYQIPAVANVSS